MSSLRCSLLIFVFLAAAGTSGPVFGAEGSRRLALVLGNSAYKNVSPLTNPANDATDIAQKLKSLQFEVIVATDVGHAKMISLLQQFKDRVTREHVALFFFAGHGVTVNNESFLIPVDAPSEIELDDKGDPRAESSNTSPCQDVVSAYAARSVKDRNCVPRRLQDECGPTRLKSKIRLTANKPCSPSSARTRQDGNKAEPVFRRRLSGLCYAARQRRLRRCRQEQSVHQGPAQAYRRQGNPDPGADDPGAQAGDARNCEQASAMGGSRSQRKFLLRFAGYIGVALTNFLAGQSAGSEGIAVVLPVPLLRAAIPVRSNLPPNVGAGIGAGL